MQDSLKLCYFQLLVLDTNMNLDNSNCLALHALGISSKMKMHLNFKQFTHLNIGLPHSFSHQLDLTWKTVLKHPEPDLII